jgi:hypothetical protein
MCVESALFVPSEVFAFLGRREVDEVDITN